MDFHIKIDRRERKSVLIFITFSHDISFTKNLVPYNFFITFIVAAPSVLPTLGNRYTKTVTGDIMHFIVICGFMY